MDMVITLLIHYPLLIYSLLFYNINHNIFFVVHPSCIDLTLDMVPHIQSYAWQCTDCKTCAQCHDPADEDKMLFCDMCDRGYVFLFYYKNKIYDNIYLCNI